MTDFPALYGEATTGKSKQWSIRVFERTGCGVIETTHGYVGGKLQVNEKIISEGKNIGKKNETSALQQAINDARSAWQKKKDSGYSPSNESGAYDDSDIEMGGTGRSKAVDENVPSPMLAHDFNKRGKDISFPCLVQPKLDGTRCVAIPGKGLFSRNKKQYPNLGHILDEISRLPEGVVLDGELYSDELTFQEIVGIVKRETLKKGDDEKQLKIKFHVYDIVNDSMGYNLRYNNLQLLFRKYSFKYLELVRTDMCESRERMIELHARYVAEGYEGIMLRNKEGKYKQSRSSDLQKFKEFFDQEYEIVNFTCGEGLEEGCVIWICKNEEGGVFNVRPRGSREERQVFYDEGSSYVGKMLTVRYQEKTDGGMPRFPVGITIRDYE
jgi:DNA ligase-1